MNMINKISTRIMPGVNFAVVLILILQCDLNAKRIAGWYFGVG